MDEVNHSPRTQAWLDGLPMDQQQVAGYSLSLEGGTQASAHQAILTWQLGSRVTALEKRSIWKDGAKAMGMIGGMIAAGFAGWHGRM